MDDSVLSAFYEPEPATVAPATVASATQSGAGVALPAGVASTGQAAAAQPAAAQPVVAQPAASAVTTPTPPAAEPTVVNQWTDESGHTWRVMSDSTHRWWNGSDWQKV